MMRCQQPVHHPRLRSRQPRLLGTRIDITAEQQHFPGCLDAQDTGRLIAIARLCPLPLTEMHPVPLPGLPSTSFGLAHQSQAPWLTTDQLPYRHTLQHSSGTTGMIVIGMTDDEPIQLTHAQRTQAWQDLLCTAVE